MGRVVTLMTAALAVGLVAGVLLAEPHQVRTRIVIAEAVGAQVPPDTNRPVIGLWTDGEFRISRYTRLGWAAGRGSDLEGLSLEYVTTWWELPSQEQGGER